MQVGETLLVGAQFGGKPRLRSAVVTIAGSRYVRASVPCADQGSEAGGCATHVTIRPFTPLALKKLEPRAASGFITHPVATKPPSLFELPRTAIGDPHSILHCISETTEFLLEELRMAATVTPKAGPRIWCAFPTGRKSPFAAAAIVLQTIARAVARGRAARSQLWEQSRLSTFKVCHGLCMHVLLPGTNGSRLCNELAGGRRDGPRDACGWTTAPSGRNSSQH